MDTKIQFQKNAAVLAADGEQVGSLNRVVVNPSSKVLTGIVVRTGALFNQEEKVVPIEWVDKTTAEHVVLNKTAADADAFPPLEEERIVDTEESVQRSDVNVQPMVYGAPVFGATMPATSGEQFTTRVDQNIPEGTVAMKEGARVISADGKHVGDVERVFTGVPNEQVTHLLVSRGKIKKKTKLVPIDWVDSMNEDEVDLLVNKVSIDNLADLSTSK